MISAQRRIVAVCQPTKTVCNFPEPWSSTFPIYFFDILDRVESKLTPACSSIWQLGFLYAIKKALDRRCPVSSVKNFLVAILNYLAFKNLNLG